MSEVTELEKQKENAKELIARRDMTVKLYNNPEFKKLIVDGFCLHDCARFAQASGDSLMTKEQRDDAMAMAQAAGHLRRFLTDQIVLGNNAANQMDQLEDEIEAARQEEEGAK